MEFTYKNHRAIIRETQNKDFSLTIIFGEMEITETIQAENEKAVKALSKQLINELCADLPPALSYKYYNDED